MTKPFGIFAFSVASLCAAGLLGAASADAKTFHYNFSLTGGQETPSNTSKGSGLAKVTYDDKSHELGWTVSYKGLTGDATMAHFHGPAKKGAAAGCPPDAVRSWPALSETRCRRRGPGLRCARQGRGDRSGAACLGFRHVALFRHLEHHRCNQHRAAQNQHRVARRHDHPGT